MNRWPPRPRLGSRFYKAHGLGNDYLVFEEGSGWDASDANVARVCDRFRGPGGDGIVALLGGARTDPTEPGRIEVRLRMFNPDGGEFERSGNGLRVLGSYLARRDPSLRAARISVGGDQVEMTFHGRRGPVHDISVAMGRARTGAGAVGLDPAALRSDGTMEGPDGDPLAIVPVSVGNPHLVVLCEGEDEPPTEQRLARIGPWLVAHPALRHGANVQLAAVSGGGRCRALIWERGVGRTSASGTSSCAVAVAMVSTGRLAPGAVAVEMPGGTLRVDVDASLDVRLRGPVEEVFDGELSEALLATFEPAP
jgi:diaminopimelate epimerase